MNKFTPAKSINATKLSSPRGDAEYYSSGAPSEFLVTYTPIKAGAYNVYLFGVIESATQFISAIEVMSNATELDSVMIHLSTDGGSMDATDTFITAMNRCEAKVVVNCSGGTHSAGTIILLNADEFCISEGANFLIHNGSCGAVGKFSDFVTQSKHTVAYMNRVLRKTYRHFLTPDEIEALIEGKDFWIDADEFTTRYEARNVALFAEFEAMQLAEAEEQLALELSDDDASPLLGFEGDLQEEESVAPVRSRRSRKGI